MATMHRQPQGLQIFVEGQELPRDSDRCREAVSLSAAKARFNTDEDFDLEDSWKSGMEVAHFDISVQPSLGAHGRNTHHGTSEGGKRSSFSNQVGYIASEERTSYRRGWGFGSGRQEPQGFKVSRGWIIAISLVCCLVAMHQKSN